LQQPQVHPAAGQQPVPDMKERLKKANNYAVIITNNNPDQLIYTGPIMRHIYHQYGIKASVFTTHPLNHNWLSFIKGLPYVEDVKMSPTIEQDHFHKLEEEFDAVAMFNFGAAVGQGIPRGMNPTIAMAAMIQIVVPGETLLTYDLPEELLSESETAADVYLAERGIEKGDYVVFAPFFAANTPQEQMNAQNWSRERWLDLVDQWGTTVIIIGEPHNDVMVPDGITEDVFSVNTDDVFLQVGLMNSAKCVVCIDNWYAVVTRALKQPIVQIHTGMPISWSGATYDHLSQYHGRSTIVASIIPSSIEVSNVIDAYHDLMERMDK